MGLLRTATSGSGNADVKTELLKKTLMDKMTPEQSRQFSQLLGDKSAMESLMKSEQALRLMGQLKNKK